MIRTHTIFGIGNPLIDIVINVQEEDLIRLEMNKGTMELVSGDHQLEIIKYFKGANIFYSPGGSAPNTIIACSGLGIGSFIQGKIGNDKFGSIYLDQIKNLISSPGDTNVTLKVNNNNTYHQYKLNEKRKIDQNTISQLKNVGVTLKIY